MISKDLDNIIDYCTNNTTKEMKLGLNEIYSNIESQLFKSLEPIKIISNFSSFITLLILVINEL